MIGSRMRRSNLIGNESIDPRSGFLSKAAFTPAATLGEDVQGGMRGIYYEPRVSPLRIIAVQKEACTELVKFRGLMGDRVGNG